MSDDKERIEDKVLERVNERLSGKRDAPYMKPKPVRGATKDRSLRGKKRKGASKLPKKDMYVEVNEENIERFALVEYTGNTKEELLALAKEAEASDTVLTVKLPNMAPRVDTNLFDVVVGEAVEGFDNERCRYEKRWTDPIGEGAEEAWVCIIHYSETRHNVMENPEAPCIASELKKKEE